MRAALVGCGNIAERYAKRILDAHQLELVGATDLLPARAAALADRFGGTAYPSLEALLADDGVELVVNLTAPQAHAAVTSASLEAGKHVHTEKPVALRYEEARELGDLAARRGVRLSCAPATFLGEAIQTAWKLVRAGALRKEIGRADELELVRLDDASRVALGDVPAADERDVHASHPRSMASISRHSSLGSYVSGSCSTLIAPV